MEIKLQEVITNLFVKKNVKIMNMKHKIMFAIYALILMKIASNVKETHRILLFVYNVMKILIISI